MEEKIITGHKNGMLVLLLELVLYIRSEEHTSEPSHP